MSSNPTALLESLGLVFHEPTVYRAARPLGTVAASVIATRVDIPRSTARYTCEQLVKKGLMTATTKGNTKLFTAEHPNRLYALLHAEQESLDRKADALATTMQSLQDVYNPLTSLPKVTFFE